ncbi:hypothetical protein F5Y13DRAFT_130547 [Hypoxylon sp. FL1857]|nr:hypothetical protein F5Y13DRAFT_130547 [Hypoxylon sp. FL1857]
MASTGSSIRNSMLKHWRNSSISLSRSGSKKDKSESKAAKRQSFHATTTRSPESREAPATNGHQGQTDNDGKTANEAPPPAKVISLHVTVHIAPENVERFLAAFKTVFDLVVEEPECLFFEVYKSVEEPGKISWVENWSKDVQWLMEHQITKPYYKEYFELTEPMFLKPREARVFELVGPGFSVVKGSQLAP